MKQVVANRASLIFYCADCDREFGEDPQNRIGQRFVCPVSVHHFAQVVKPPAGKSWLKVERAISHVAEYSPMGWVGGGGRAGRYHLIRFGLLIGLLLLARPDRYWLYNASIIALTVFFLCDILIISTYATFVSRFPTNTLRTIILTISSLLQVATGYAVFYRLDGGNFSQVLGRIDAIYFSVVTISTVGYGEITPARDAHLTKLLVISELVVGFYVLVALFAVVTGWVNDRPGRSKAMSLEEMGVTMPEPDSTRSGLNRPS